MAITYSRMAMQIAMLKSAVRENNTKLSGIQKSIIMSEIGKIVQRIEGWNDEKRKR